MPDLASLATDYEELGIVAAVVTWRSGEFDALLRERADDRIGPVLFANLERRTAFAPYDGGADLFLDSPRAVPYLERRWASWLPAHPDGL